MIFAVTREQINVYERLMQHIEGASAGTLSENSENVVDLVKDQYSVRNIIFSNILFIIIYYYTLYVLALYDRILSTIDCITENIIFCGNERYSIQCNKSHILFELSR